MRINELLSETHHTDEGVGQFLGKAANAVGGAVGGVQGAWQGMKDVYGQKRDRVANVAQRNVQRAGGYKKPAPGSTTPATSEPTLDPSGESDRPYVAPAAPAAPPAAPEAPPAAPEAPPAAPAAPPAAPAAPPAAPAAPPAAPAAPRVPAGVAKKEVDQVVNLVSKVRARDRQNIVKYAADKITALQKLPATAEGRTFHSNFLGMKI